MSSVVVPIGNDDDSDYSDNESGGFMADDEGFGALNKERDAAPRFRDRRSRLEGVSTKGRGFQVNAGDERYSGRGGRFEQIEVEANVDTPAQKSVEGWVVIVTGVHSEAQEDDVYELFAEIGDIKQLVLGLDRRTGYTKGYAMIEYATFDEAQKAVSELNGEELLDQKVEVEFAFLKPEKAHRR